MPLLHVLSYTTAIITPIVGWKTGVLVGQLFDSLLAFTGIYALFVGVALFLVYSIKEDSKPCNPHEIHMDLTSLLKN